MGVGHRRPMGARRTLLNLYGPTESSIVATISRPLDGLSNPPIGVPVDGSTVAVLDAELRPVASVRSASCTSQAPAWPVVPGRPGLTAERFVASVLGPGRMYRTGDLVRRRSTASTSTSADPTVRSRSAASVWNSARWRPCSPPTRMSTPRSRSNTRARSRLSSTDGGTSMSNVSGGLLPRDYRGTWCPVW
ncbi:AMP-binding protein [Rhodococcus hoagii]|nr:AMP-binding protein [Prescottella equi]